MACSRRGGLEPGSRGGDAPHDPERPAWGQGHAAASREATCLGPRRPPRKRPVPLCSPGASGPLPAAGRAASRAPRSRPRRPGRREPPRRARPRPLLPAPVPQPPCGLRPLGHQTDPERTEVDAAHRANRPPSEDPSRAARAEQVRVRASYLCAVTCSPAVKEHEVIRPEVSEIPAFSLGNPFLIIEARSYL